MLEKLLQNKVIRRVALPILATTLLTACAPSALASTQKPKTSFNTQKPSRNSTRLESRLETELKEDPHYFFNNPSAHEGNIDITLFKFDRTTKNQYKVTTRVTTSPSGEVLRRELVNRELVDSDRGILSGRIPVDGIEIRVYQEKGKKVSDPSIWFGNRERQRIKRTDENGKVSFFYTTENEISREKAKKATFDVLRKDYVLGTTAEFFSDLELIFGSTEGEFNIEATNEEGEVLATKTINFMDHKPRSYSPITSRADKAIRARLENYVQATFKMERIAVEVRDLETEYPLSGALLEFKPVEPSVKGFSDLQYEFLSKYLKNPREHSRFLVPLDHIEGVHFIRERDSTNSRGVVYGKSIVPCSYEVRAMHPDYGPVKGVVRFDKKSLEKEIFLPKQAQTIRFKFGKGKKGQIRDK
ncbi:hypothetical protein HOG16_02735 [Candidatus Woesearchaeota archaeon]|jgi:hypothetical protein|nr:hypothetical protein [Candidatus Woesearchaeota archaeon]MBT4322013.1 hypothetical protein [Candidatus Woesearchaeota archaeon]MBT4630759.1 hypothetical protein [Candidatus Woesearchaeota archaeon]